MTIAEAGVRAITGAGWAMLLTGPGHKRPHYRTPSVHDATRDAGLFEAWALENPDCGLAVNLGASGLAVVEDDGPAGLIELAALEAAHGVLPVTWEVQARRGRHRFFRTRGKVLSRGLGTELELRAWGEYVIVPPSKVNGVTRRWVPATIRRPLAPLPDWLASWAPPTPAGATVPVTSSPTLAALAIEEVTTRLASRPASPGTRRGTALFAAACSLGRHVRAGTLRREEAEAVLREAGARLRLHPVERDRSISRGLALGPQRNVR